MRRGTSWERELSSPVVGMGWRERVWGGRGPGGGEWPRPSSPQEGLVLGWRVFAQANSLKLLSCPPTLALVPSPP